MLFTPNSISDYHLGCLHTCMGGDRSSELWQLPDRTKEEVREHINFLELRAAFLALQTYAAHFDHQHIMLLIDNRTAISFIIAISFIPSSITREVLTQGNSLTSRSRYGRGASFCYQHFQKLFHMRFDHCCCSLSYLIQGLRL